MIVAFRLVLLAALALGAPAGLAQVAEPAPRVVMNLAAHPDDEDALTMAYYRHAENAVVHSVIYTRGEGGQNEIGPELYAELGAIRTAETEAAARHYGSQVHFLNFDDFGYSRHASETFERWGGEEEVTARLVYVIRKLKPDVLFTNHDTLTVGPRTQHGHHQAVGISAYRAMQLAADPAFRPEQLAEAGVDLWQPQRLFLRLWRGGQDTARVHVPVGAPLADGCEAPMEIAVRGVAEHRSQGFDLFAPRFRQERTYFVLLAEAPGAPPLPDGATTLDAGLPPNPHAATAGLTHLIDSGRVARIPGGVTLSDSVAVPGQSVTLTWPAGDGTRLALSGAVDTTLTASPATIRIPAGARPTVPASRAQYDRFVNHPPVQAALYGSGGIVAAEHLALQIAPPLVLAVDEAVMLPAAYPDRILLRRGANAWRISGTAYEGAASGADIEVQVIRRDGGEVLGTTSVSAPIRGGRLEAEVGMDLPADLEPAGYDLVVTGTLDGTPATARLALDAHVPPRITLPEGLRVGFVRSYDRATEAALLDIGADVTVLDSLALASGDLSDLHTILVDIRAYLVRPDLRAHNDRLLEWVRGGGHLIVTYQKTFEWNEDHADPFVEGTNNPAGFAPLPLRLGRDRVTDHTAAVTKLVPDHPLFNEPHRLRAEDWDGWIQERGLYFPQSYDPAFVELLAMSDPGEAPLRSSTLLAPVGDGTYLFTALGFYRQLGAFVPGAYRALANMVSLPLTDGRAVP